MEHLAPLRSHEMICKLCEPSALISVSNSPLALMQSLADHVQEAHTPALRRIGIGRQGALVEGTHFDVRVAPFRCDLCGVVAEPPWWNYVTDGALDVEDDQWLVCDGCAELVEQREDPEARIALGKRCVTQQARNTGTSETEVMVAVGPIITLFLRHIVSREREGWPQSE